MIIKLNKRKQISLETLLGKDFTSMSFFDIELFFDSKNWIQFFKEDNVISVAKSTKGKIQYCATIDSSDLNKYLLEYTQNPEKFELNWAKDSKNLKNAAKKYDMICKSLRKWIVFLFFLFCIHTVYIVCISNYSGNVFHKVFCYYTDHSLHPRQKCLPIYLISACLIYVFFFIKKLISRKERICKRGLCQI